MASGRRRRRAGAWATGVTAAAALGHYLPSVCILGQWSPVRLRALPRGWCRWRGPDAAPRLGLSFDDGPSPDTTPRTLDLLDDLGMRATFFVLGELALRYRDLVEEIARRGHTVGSHGQRHEHHLLRRPSWIAADVAASVDAIGAIGAGSGPGGRPRWYRPTYGQLTARTVLEARRHDMEVVLWSVWGHEWSEPDEAPVMARLERGLEPGAIVLLHDTDVMCPPGTAARTHRTLELLAESLERRGLEAVTLDTLLAG